MNAYLTFVMMFAITIWPVAFIVSVIVGLTQIKHTYHEMYTDSQPIPEISAIELLVAVDRKKRKERMLKTTIAIISIALSVVIALLMMKNLYCF